MRTGSAYVPAELLNKYQGYQLHIIGIDISISHLRMGKKLLKERKLSDRLSLILANAERLPFRDHCFDSVMITENFRAYS